MNSLNTLLSAEFSKHDMGEDGEVHVLKPSEIAKGKKRKNAQPKEESSEGDEADFVPLAPKAGAHMVLPFIPPKFPSLKGEGNALIKPSEYLKSLSKPGSNRAVGVDIHERLSDDGVMSSSSSSCEDSRESGIDSPGCSLPSSAPGVSPTLSSSPSSQLPVIKEESGGAPPPPPPPPGPPPPPPPPQAPAHPKLKSTQSAPPAVSESTLSNPQVRTQLKKLDI